MGPGGWLPHEVRLGVAVVIAVAGLLFALLQPGGRPLDQWLLAGVLFVALPRRLVWRPGTTQLASQRASSRAGPSSRCTRTGSRPVSTRPDAEPASERPVLWWRRRS